MEKKELMNHIDKWNEMKNNYHFPKWEEFPEIDLYMDQVVELINRYISEAEPLSEGRNVITPAMINNYVKLKTVPPPCKKKYSRKHIAYILLVCIMKQTISMSTIQSIIPWDMDEERIHMIYALFAQTQKKSFISTVENLSKELTAEEDGDISTFILQLVSKANVIKGMAERLADAEDDLNKPKAKATPHK